MEARDCPGDRPPGDAGPRDRSSGRLLQIDAAALDGENAQQSGGAIRRHAGLETARRQEGLAGVTSIAMTSVHCVDLKISFRLKVDDVTGIGDDVRAGLAPLGVDVQLLGEDDLATGDPSRFNAIMISTRDDAVCEDLNTYHCRA